MRDRHIGVCNLSCTTLPYFDPVPLTSARSLASSPSQNMYYKVAPAIRCLWWYRTAAYSVSVRNLVHGTESGTGIGLDVTVVFFDDTLAPIIRATTVCSIHGVTG
jgi:hypothetical protein